MEVGDALVVAKEWVDAPQIHQLVSLLRSRLEILAKETWGVEVLQGSPLGEHFPALTN